MDQNFGYVGLKAMKDQAEANGDHVTLVDNGDSVQGEVLGTMTKGTAILSLMNAMGYDVAIPGNHEFDYGMEPFLQVAGMTYEIHTDIESSVTMDADGMFTGVAGAYRVQNVMVHGEPLDPDRIYTVASTEYILTDQGDGFAMFKDCHVLLDSVKLDNQLLIDYITETLGGVISDEYADPYGQGRIIAVE